MLAQVSDRGPTKEEVTFWNDLSGGLPWVSCSHHDRSVSDTTVPKNQMPGNGTIAYTAVALDFQYVLNPDKDRHYGWKKPTLHAKYWRWGWFNDSLLPTIRHEAECNITGKQRGLAHMGGDYWYAIRDKGGTKRLGSVSARWPETYWHSLNIHSWYLAPGADGPVGTARLELLREGVQECEARIYLEAALTDPALKAKLGEELASRAQQLLDDQQRNLWRAKGATDEDFAKYGHVPSYRTYDYDIMPKWNEDAGNRWFIASGWQDRVAKLYSTAAEAAAKLK